MEYRQYGIVLIKNMTIVLLSLAHGILYISSLSLASKIRTV